MKEQQRFPAAGFFIRLEQERSKNGWDTKDLCRAAGVDASVYLSLADSTLPPTVEVVRRLSAAAGLSEFEGYVLTGYIPALPGYSSGVREAIAVSTFYTEAERAVLLQVIDMMDAAYYSGSSEYTTEGPA